MGGEYLEKRFGTIAIEKGFITLGQFMEAMKIQVREDMEEIERRPVGQILTQLGHMNKLQILEVLKMMGLPV